MSRSTTVTYGDDFFWAYDVSLCVLVGQAVIVLDESYGGRERGWLAALRRALCRAVAVPDLGLRLDRDWGRGDRLETLTGLLREAARRLAARDRIGVADVAAWRPYLGVAISLRGATTVPVGPIIELADAIVDLVRGVLTPPPGGELRDWFYGVEPGRRVLGGAGAGAGPDAEPTTDATADRGQHGGD